MAEYLPKTLVYLNLGQSLLKKDSMPILRSYLESNDSTLKKLILNTYDIKEDLEKQGLLSLPNIKVSNVDSWPTKYLYNKVSYDLKMSYMSDKDWSQLFMELTKDDIRFLVKYV